MQLYQQIHGLTEASCVSHMALRAEAEAGAPAAWERLVAQP